MRQRIFTLFLACIFLLTACGSGGSSASSSASSPPPEDHSSGVSPAPEAPAAPLTLAAYPAVSFHPLLSGNKANLTLAPLMYEGLFSVDSQFQAVPLLCAGYTVSEDRLTWTFTLRSGVTFSDGTPLTGETAAQALQTALDPASRYAGRLSCVQSIRGSEGKLILTLSQPNSSLPLLLDIPLALGSGARPLGTGPYLLTDSGGSLSLTARSDWWQGPGSLPVQEIRLASLTKPDELISAFNSGEVSLIDVDLTGNSELGSSGSYQVWDYPSTDLLYLGFNTSQGLCQDPEIRRAVARAIDRDTLSETIFARHAAAAAIPVHPVSPLYNGELAKRLSYDPSILTGLELKGRALTLLVNIENTAKSAAANEIARQLQEAGLRVTVERLPWEEYTASLAARDFDLYLGEVYLTPDFDLSALIAPGGTLNYGGWEDGVISGLLSAFRTAEGELRQSAAASLYRYLCQQAPIAPICFKNGSVLTQYGRLDQLNPTQYNVFYDLSQWTVP